MPGPSLSAQTVLLLKPSESAQVGASPGFLTIFYFPSQSVQESIKIHRANAMKTKLQLPASSHLHEEK